MKIHLRNIILMVYLLCVGVSFAFAANKNHDLTLRIAFLDAPSSTLNLNAFDMRLLREYLLNRPDVFDALKTKGYQDIEIVSVNDPDNIMRLLRFEGADIVFCPLSLYLNSLPVRYTPIFQLYEGSYMDQRLVIFRNPNMEEDVNTSSTMVAVSFGDMKSQPQLLSALQSSVKANKFDFIYFSNPHDIAKSVLCGLVEYGICERKILDTVMQQAWVDMSQKDVITIVNELELMPTDPVLFHNTMEAKDHTILKNRLRKAFTQFFSTQPAPMVLVPIDRADVQERIVKYRDQVSKLFQKALLTTSSRQIISEFDSSSNE